MIQIDEIKELLRLRSDGNLRHRESQTLEFKESFNFAGLSEYFRDFAAFANNKGGWLIFGVKDRPKRELIGLSDKSVEQFDKIDPEKISGFLLNLFSGDIVWEHDIVEINSMNFGVFFIEEAKVKPIICKKDEGEIRNGEIYFRYGGRTHRQWMDLVSKIGKSGPQNAAILDLNNGSIAKDNSQILVVDEKLLKGINWIKEGSFDEKSGEPTLKLVGEVQPIDTVEVIRTERINRLREYPLSAKELAEKIKNKIHINTNDIWRIINQNGIKNNPDYSIFNFRNKKQEEQYDMDGVIPNGVPSIYKESTVDLIITIYKNERK